MIRLFGGYDHREIPGFHVFAHSVLKRASRPVGIVPLARYCVPEGSNAFTLSRFLVPMLCGYEGMAIFCDAADMMMVGDVAKLADLYDPAFAVQVVKHPTYSSQHDRKYVGEDMECAQTNYDRKNWASVMLINCAHEGWKTATEPNLNTRPPLHWLQFRFLEDAEVGALPAAWNVLIDEGQSDEGAQLLHWTAGVPYFWHYRNARRAQDWITAAREVSGGR